MSTSTRSRRGQHLLLQLLAGLVVIGSVGWAVAADPDPSSAEECALQPVVRDHTVTQGVGSYDRLVPGKDALVRLFLSMPRCAPVDAEVQLTGATMSVQVGAVTIATGVRSTPALPTPPPVGTDPNTYPPIAQWSAAPMDDATGDPIFVLAGSVLDHPLLGAAPASISVTATLQYRSRVGGGAWQSGVAPAVGPFEAPVGVRSNPLRLLVVPMGDVSSPDDQFPASAVATVQNGMVALSRILPVPAGLSDLASSSGGIRYRFTPHLLDLGPGGLGLMGPTTDFCGKRHNFDAIQAALAERLRAWNSANPLTPADRAVGTVWEGVSVSPQEDSSCADGWGKAGPGSGAWVRVVGATTKAPSTAGSLLAMELLHTWGAVSGTSPRAAGLHSRNIEADVTDPDRAYHVAGRAWLADDRTVMNYGPPTWNEHSTVLEPEDWAHTRCALTVPAAGEVPVCGQPGGVGSAAAGIERRFSLAGVTDGTAAGTDLHTYVSDEGLETEPDPDSTFRLVQRDGSGAVLVDTGLPTAHDHSAHHHDGGTGDGGSDETATSGFAIDATVRVASGSARFELWHGAPSAAGSELLYARDADEAPEVTAVTSAPAPGGEQDVAADPFVSEGQPAISPDGSLVAWTQAGPGGDRIHVAPTDRSKPASQALPGSQPAWTSDASALVFVRDGDLVRTTVDTTGAAPTFRDEYVVYDRQLQPAAGAGVSRPSVGPGGADAVVALGGDLYVIDTGFRPSQLNPLLCPVGAALASGPCRRLVGTAAGEGAPSWSDAGIFYERGAEIRRIGADGTGDVRVTDGAMPAAAGPDLALVRDGRVWVRSLADGAESALTSGPDTWPAITGGLGVVAFERTRGGQQDVVRVDASDRIHVVTVRDDHPAELRLDVFLGDEDPITTGLRPVATTATEARFEVRARPLFGAGGALRGRVTDGWQTAWFEWGEVGGDAEVPVASIHTPVPGAGFLQFSAIPLSGDGRAGAPLDDGSLQWSLARVGGGVVRTGGGRSVDLDPPAAGWEPGQYEVRLVVTVGGRSDEHVVPITIVADVDRDGIPAPRDRRSCAAPADEDPTNFDDDEDGDGIPTSEDRAPCTSASNATADFEPDTYYFPAEGEYFSVRLSSTAVDLRGVAGGTVSIVDAARLPVRIQAVAWSIDRRGVATARFRREDLDAVLAAHPELIGGYVPIIVTGGAGATSFRALDPRAPLVQPGA